MPFLDPPLMSQGSLGNLTIWKIGTEMRMNFMIMTFFHVLLIGIYYNMNWNLQTFGILLFSSVLLAKLLSNWNVKTSNIRKNIWKRIIKCISKRNWLLSINICTLKSYMWIHIFMVHKNISVGIFEIEWTWKKVSP